MPLIEGKEKKDSVAERFADLVAGKKRELLPDGFCSLNVSLSNTFCFLTPRKSERRPFDETIGVGEGFKRGKMT